MRKLTELLSWANVDERASLPKVISSGKKNFRDASLLLIIGVLAGCSSGPSTDPNSPEALMNKDAARQKLNQRMAENRQRQAAADEQQRAAEAKAAADAEAAAAQAARPNYDPARLAMAAKPRQWANIVVPDLNINCWLKSTWVDGKMNFRFALIGQKEALKVFAARWPYMRLLFQDSVGNNLHQAILRSVDLRWADSLRNSGAPTLEFESSTDCSLEVYEQSIQWNVKWEDHID